MPGAAQAVRYVDISKIVHAFTFIIISVKGSNHFFTLTGNGCDGYRKTAVVDCRLNNMNADDDKCEVHHITLRARFYSADELLQDLRKARSLLRLNEVLLKLDRYAHRYERGSLIITSNHPFSTWGSTFVDETMAVAAADRLIYHCYLFEIQGESYGV